MFGTFRNVLFRAKKTKKTKKQKKSKQKKTTDNKNQPKNKRLIAECVRTQKIVYIYTQLYGKRCNHFLFLVNELFLVKTNLLWLASDERNVDVCIYPTSSFSIFAIPSAPTDRYRFFFSSPNEKKWIRENQGVLS